MVVRREVSPNRIEVPRVSTTMNEMLQNLPEKQRVLVLQHEGLVKAVRLAQRYRKLAREFAHRPIRNSAMRSPALRSPGPSTIPFHGGEATSSQSAARSIWLNVQSPSNGMQRTAS